MRAHTILAPAFLLLAASITSASESQVTGTFRVGKTVIAPKHAAAYRTRDSFDARKIVTELVLSEYQFDVAGAAAALDPHTFMMNDPSLRSGNYIILWINENGDVDMNATFTEGMIQYLASTEKKGIMNRELKAALKENEPGRVAGRVYTPKPVKAYDGKYELDVTFSTDVRGREVGALLPAGGGEPGKAFQGLLAAIAKKDGAVLKRFLSRNLVEILYDSEIEAENYESAINILNFTLPKKDVKVVGGDLKSDTAILEVEGAIGETTMAVYLIRMVKEGGKWMFDEASMAGLV